MENRENTESIIERQLMLRKLPTSPISTNTRKNQKVFPEGLSNQIGLIDTIVFDIMTILNKGEKI